MITDPTQLVEIRAEAIMRLMAIADSPVLTPKERCKQIHASLLRWLKEN